MRYRNIVCLDDLLRDEWWPAKNFFYDLMREPIKQAIGFDIKSSPRFDSCYHNLDSDFSSYTFRELCFKHFNHWSYHYCQIPQEAENYLLKYLDKDFLVISYEMPEYLRNLISRVGAYYLDIRISPLRFATDLYVCIRTNDIELHKKLKKFEVPEEEIYLEASLVKASVRHLRRYSSRNLEYNNSLIFLGQTPDDASLIDCRKRRFVTINDFIDKLQAILENEENKARVLYYKPHPSAPQEHVIKEIEFLRNVLKKDIKLCYENIYILLGSDDDCRFIGISSSALQEATFFDKISYTLFKPICDLSEYVNVRFVDFISPYFYKYLFGVDKRLKYKYYRYSYPNMLRQLHNVWWGYSEYLIKDRHFYIEMFKIIGYYDEIEILKHKITQLEEHIKTLKNYEKEYFSILNSNSWKITKPLRDLRRILRSLINKFRNLRIF